MKYPDINLALLPFAIFVTLVLFQIFHRKDNIVEFTYGERKIATEQAPKLFLDELSQKTRIGLVNLEESEVKKSGIKGSFTIVNFEKVYENNNITWKDLFPDWISEDPKHGLPPSCPKIPMPDFSTIDELDLVIAQFPCGKNRDVFRLQVHLVAANLAVHKGRRNGRGNLKMIFVSSCEPMIDIFRCDDLVKNEGRWWMYEIDAIRLLEKVRLPVGTCEFVAPLQDEGNNKRFDATELKPLLHHSKRREAYVTIVVSSGKYVCGAIALAYSLRKTGTTRDLILLHDEFLTQAQLNALQTAGWTLRQIKNIRNPHSRRGVTYEYTYSKFRMFQLTDYDKLVFVDSDVIVIRNLDILFSYPSLSARVNQGEVFNSGVFVIEPSNCTFETLMRSLYSITPYDGSDQGFLNEVFVWWHRLSVKINYFKMKWAHTTNEKLMLDKLFSADPAEIYIIHYMGLKPWVCYRDYDCNWDSGWAEIFANDVAHWRWWKLYDEFDPSVKSMCKLSIKQKHTLEAWRREAEKKGYGDGHWKWNITDPRRNE